MLGRIQHNGFINIESTKSDNTKHTYVASITNAVAALKWFWDSIWRPKKLETIFNSMKMWLKKCSKIQTIIKVNAAMKLKKYSHFSLFKTVRCSSDRLWFWCRIWLWSWLWDWTRLWLLPWFWIKPSIVILVNRISNNDSNGIKIMKNGPRDRKLWQFLVLKVLTKLYQSAINQ